VTTKTSTTAKRAGLLERLFPGGVPVLWCPSLTHYDEDGAIDGPRIAAHLRHLSPHVKGLLIPGSTGDGWELSERETSQLLDIALDQARELELHLLIGALKTDAGHALKTIHDTVERLKSRAKESDAERALAKARVCGFTVCPPRGKELSQEEIGRALAAILETRLPIAIYQLPQITQNEISPELASSLAARFENFILFKDTSGADRVALSGKSLEGVFTVRGAEGDYARWLNAAGGPYHGFLLSAANCFARELHQIIEDISGGRLDAARQMSERLASTVSEVFALVAGLPDGNPFANANKAMDHFFAHGPRAASVPSPRLHAGSRLPAEVIRATGEGLSRHGLMPAKGYLEISL
jgi:dihydrodipicolinate synthase/N-acetylneuraminate lyase